MRVNAELIVKCRKERSWSQDELATAAGLNLRTIQRVEKHRSASLQTKKALAAALDIDTRDLDHKDYFPNPGGAAGETLLPGLGTLFQAGRVRPTVCHGCGLVRVFASEDVRNELKGSKHWRLVDA